MHDTLERARDDTSLFVTHRTETGMATTPETITAPTDAPLVRTPPDPVPSVTPTQAVWLVPVDDAKRTQLEAKVDSFVDDLIAQDVNSPEFGKRVDAIAAMGQKELR